MKTRGAERFAAHTCAMTLPDVSDRTRRRLVWIVPVIVIGVIALVASMTGASSASTPKLKPMSAKQLITAVQRSTVTAFSGTVEETTDLGLPSLPGDTQRASLSWQSFLTGTHSVRVWADGPDKQRLALIGQLSEAEVVHDGRNVWTYTSHTNTASHTVLPAHTGRTHPAVPDATDPTPAAVADRLLKAITPSTVVSVDTAQTVAGRPAYVISLAPRDANSTVRKATIAIDATRFVPLRVQVFGSGSSPAISIGFTHISFHRPSASTFAFHLPKGATLQPNPMTAPEHRRYADYHRVRGAHHRAVGLVGGEAARPGVIGGAAAHPTVIGSGWTTVLEVHDLAALGGGLLDNATTSLPNGARLLHTALVNAVLLPDGRAFVGAVEPSAIEHIATTTPR